MALRRGQATIEENFTATILADLGESLKLEGACFTKPEVTFHKSVVDLCRLVYVMKEEGEGRRKTE